MSSSGASGKKQELAISLGPMDCQMKDVYSSFDQKISALPNGTISSRSNFKIPTVRGSSKFVTFFDNSGSVI